METPSKNRQWVGLGTSRRLHAVEGPSVVLGSYRTSACGDVTGAVTWPEKRRKRCARCVDLLREVIA